MAIQDYYNTGAGPAMSTRGTVKRSQSFFANQAYDLSAVKFEAYRVGSPGTVTIDIHAVDGNHFATGAVLATGTTDGDTLTTDTGGEWREVSMTAFSLVSGTEYAIVISASSGDNSNTVMWLYDSSGSVYNGTLAYYSGGTWYELPVAGDTDAMFEVWGDAGGATHELTGTLAGAGGVNGSLSVTIDDEMSGTIAAVGGISGYLRVKVELDPQVTNKYVVAAGNGEVWYEMAAGEMTELTAANGDIDTTDQLQMFQAYQKAFIVNGENLKVADFVGVKLTHTALTTAHAHGDILTQDQGSSNFAYMVVDFTDTAKTHTYGYAYYGGSGTAFNTANNCTGDTGTTFVPTVVTNAPHWYDYTVYPGGSSGTMPEVAYLGCKYRGRIVLAGNPRKPFQWYMSRVGDPFDYLYTTDAGSPVSGGNSDAGEIGDNIKSLIPYHDDYLVFGCANSIWLMSGDPASGGSLDPISEDTGIFGADAYCWGEGGTLYFWGTNGLYKMNMPGKPACISGMRLPSIVADEDVNPATHRISMVYDRIRVGILINLTKISDGSNSNYWYDLRASDDSGIGGFFPEVYPDECGVYSSVHYGANDPDFGGVLVGCKDGYIRKFDDAAKDDDVGSTDTAIDSSVLFGPLSLTGLGENAILQSIEATLGGGGIGGTGGDSNDVTCNIYAERTAEGVVEDVDAVSNIKATFTVSGPGKTRGNNLRNRIRSEFFGIEIGNSTASQSWSIERVLLSAEKSGRRF